MSDQTGVTGDRPSNEQTSVQPTHATTPEDELLAQVVAWLEAELDQQIKSFYRRNK